MRSMYGYEIYHTLRAVRESNREQILRFLELLADDPFRKGDYAERDSTGRQFQIKVIGKFALYYWPDHAEKEVRIIDLVDADTS